MSEGPMSKPARLQVDPDNIPDDDKPPQTGTTFNVWYLKWSGGGDSSTRQYTKLKFRVNIKRDSGYTKAKSNTFLCLFFARGCCYLGKKCQYGHRLPLDTDFFNPTQDCFGRDKTSDYRDDMDGVGSINKHNRTLYVGGLHMHDKIENSITKHFQEFGSIEKVRVLYSKSCAFVTYRLESEAQFAKEALQNQSLDGKDVLNIRWASEDPNPAAQREEKKRLEEIALNTVKNLLNLMHDDAPPAKRAKVVVEEPEEPQESEDIPQTQVKQIEDHKNPTILFNSSSLDTLAKIRSRRKEILASENTTTVSSILGDYSSDEEEED
jgi:RNA-binding proteins (RRM domain)